MCTTLFYYTCVYIYSLLNSCGYWTLNKYYYYYYYWGAKNNGYTDGTIGTGGYVEDEGLGYHRHDIESQQKNER